MAKRKRKERSEERAGGTVIPLHAVRGDTTGNVDGATPQASTVVPTQPPREEPRAAEPITQEDDHPDVQNFFAAEKAAPPGVEPWTDLEPPEHDHEHEGASSGRRNGMVWTGAIAGVGLLLIGAFLLYHKVLMPTPEELGSGPVSLPTPDMMRGVEQPVLEPEPEEAAEPDEQAAEPTLPGPRLEGAPSEVTPAAPDASPQPADPGAPPGAIAPAGEVASAPPNAPQPASTAAPEADAELAAARKLGYGRSGEQALLKLIEQRPGSAATISALSLLYLNQGKNQQAKERAQQALSLDATNDEAWIVLGAAEDALGRHREAREAYAKCAELPAGKYIVECKRMVR